MGTPKASLKHTRKPKVAGPVGYDTGSATLDGTVLAALRAAREASRTGPASRKAGRAVRSGAKPAGKRAPAPKSQVNLDDEQLAALREQSRRFRESLRQQGLLSTRTVRVRPKGEVDRRFLVEYALDPDDRDTVLLRVRAASNAELPEEAPAMMTTQEAADVLNVSRPYVAQLVDAGRFRGVERTQAGHRRIPASEVERMRSEMAGQRRQALDEIEQATAALREHELKAARNKWKRKRVVAKAA